MATHESVGSRAKWWQVFWNPAIPIPSVLAVTDPIKSKLLAWLVLLFAYNSITNHINIVVLQIFQWLTCLSWVDKGKALKLGFHKEDTSPCEANLAWATDLCAARFKGSWFSLDRKWLWAGPCDPCNTVRYLWSPVALTEGWGRVWCRFTYRRGAYVPVTFPSRTLYPVWIRE